MRKRMWSHDPEPAARCSLTAECGASPWKEHPAATAMALLTRLLRSGIVASAAIACADAAFGPTLTDRWGGSGVELDARQARPTMRLNCGQTVRFRDAIPLTADGAFTVEAGLASAVTSGAPVTVTGQLTGPHLVLTLTFPGTAAGTPAQQFLLYRGRAGDFPTEVICAL